MSNESYSYDGNDQLDGDTYAELAKSRRSAARETGRRPVGNGNGNTTFAIGITTGDTYDFKNRLVRRVTPTGITIDLKYNSDGNRVAKAINGVETRYLVDTNSLTGYAQVLEELRDNGAGGLEVFRTYAIGHNQISQTQLIDDGVGGEEWMTSFYMLDEQGSIWGLSDTAGEVTDVYFYDAFGIHLNEWGDSTPNVYRYTGEQWDEDLGHYYLRARYYEPNRGRFWTMDPFEGFMTDPQSLHKYLYAHGNPVMYWDPSGMYTLKEVGISMVIGSIVNVTLTVVSKPSFFLEASLEEIGRELGFSIRDGALSGVFGGIGGKLALRLFPPLKNALLRGIASGAGGGAASQLAKELYSVVVLQEPLELRNRGGRIIIATVVGAGVGGISFKFESLVWKTRGVTMRTSQGLTVPVSWMEITRFELSRTGAAGAGGVSALGSILEVWFHDMFDL